MLRMRTAVLWLVGCLLASQVLATIDDYFKLSVSKSVTGNCDGFDETLDTDMDDVSELAQFMSKAVQYAKMNLAQESEENERKSLVARKLFTEYFGIEFDGSQPTEATEDEWSTLTTNIKTYSDFISTKNYPTQKAGPYLFCEAPGQWFDWDAAALGPDGGALSDKDGNGLSIRDVYSNDFSSGKSSPYWIPEMNTYMFLPTSYEKNVCDNIAPGTSETILGLCAQGNKQQIEAISSSDLPIKEVASAESILLCPKTFNGNWANYDSLGDVYSTASEAMEGNGLYADLQLTEIIPRSVVLYHEIWHMVTFWDDNGKIVQDAGGEKVGDITYDLAEALELGTDGIYNAQSYLFFAMAWWFYAARDANDWGNQTPGTFFTETFQPWSY